jgi:hypothetical protein
MCTYSQGQGKPKWKALKGSSAKIQAQVAAGGKRAKGVTKSQRCCQNVEFEKPNIISRNEACHIVKIKDIALSPILTFKG